MASGKVPAVLALAAGLAVGGILRLAPVSALFAGLSNGGVITVAAMLVIAKGVVKTGVIARATLRLLATVTTAAQALRRLIVPVGVASALMNTTPLVAMLIPAARQLQQTRDVPAREVLLPVAHATTLAGSVTLIGTSSNLLIAGIASDDGVHVSMLSFAPVALPVCLAGWVLLLLAAPRLLRGETGGEPGLQPWRVEVPVAPGATGTRLGLNPVTLLALVATCISFTFINPFSHQSNLMVMGPGAYSTRTFAKFGVPLVVVSLATVSVVTWALLNRGR